MMKDIPNYQYFMEPCLAVLSGSGLLPKKKIIEQVSDRVGLTEEQRHRMLESGKATVARSRISWALAYLKQAAVIDNPQRGFYQITERGRTLLKDSARPIDSKLLAQFSEFQEFIERASARTISKAADDTPSGDLSPEEQLGAAAKAIRADVQSQLLELLKQVDPAHFEQVVVDVLRAMGYGVDRAGGTRVVGRSGDEGIDGIIDEDILGLDSIYVQAKRWQGAVGRPEVQAFAGALQGQNARKGVMITTSTFSEPARSYASGLSGSRIVLIDGVRLAGLMYDHKVGVSDATTVVTRRLDTDYFSLD
jgi:restriction system protein